jgi:hypothetical protein
VRRIEEIAHQFLDSLLSSTERRPAPKIDWPLFRLLQIIEGTSGTDLETRERLVGLGLAEIDRSIFDAEAETRSLSALRKLYRSLLGTGWRFVADYENPMLGALRGGPLPETPPNLKRFLVEVEEVVRRAKSITVVAQADESERRLVTLLFIDEKYVGFLPGSRAAKN